MNKIQHILLKIRSKIKKSHSLILLVSLGFILLTAFILIEQHKQQQQVKASAAAISPSGEDVPAGDLPGWHQIFADDFTTDVPVGGFGGCSASTSTCTNLPSAVISKWWAYPDDWKDTSKNGTYKPSEVLSIHDGLLDMNIHTTGASGEHLIAAPLPKISYAPGSEGGLKYGRYAVRFKADPIPGYKTAWLLWPDSENWPADGEIDFPEGSLDGAISAYMHRQGGASGGDQDQFHTNTTYTNWHTAVTEWTPNSVTFYLDGQVIGTSTARIPNTPLHWVLQTETATDGTTPSNTAAGHVLIDWAAVYVPTPKIMVVGDSISQGHSGDYTWRYRLAQHLTANNASFDFVGPKNTVVDTTADGTVTGQTNYYIDANFDRDHDATSGMTLFNAQATIASEIQATNPDILLVDLGTNDLSSFNNKTASETFTNMKTFITNARSVNPNIKIVISLLTPTDTTAAFETARTDYNNKLRLLAATQSPTNPDGMSTTQSPIVISDPTPGFDPTANVNSFADTYDKTHPSPRGEYKIAAAFANALFANFGIGAAYETIPAPPAWPQAPTGLTATAGNSTATINWTAVPGALGYLIYRKDVTAGTAESYLNSTNSPSLTDNTASNGHTYEYTVSTFRALDKDSNGNTVGAAVGPKSNAMQVKINIATSPYEALLRNPISNKWYHGDSGQSVMLPNGKVLWVFGDTSIGNSGSNKAYTMINNSAILTTDLSSAVALTGPVSNGIETSWIKPNSATDDPNHSNDYYWSSTPFMDGTTLRVFLLHMYNDTSGFHPLGVDLASFSVSGSVPTLTSLVKTPGSAAAESTPLWGAGVYQDDKYTYILGSLNKHEYLVFGHYYYLARVPNGQVDKSSSWEYWNGSSYDTSASSAVVIIPGSTGLGTDVTIYKDNTGKFVIVGKKYDVFGTDLVAWKANSITGPWTEQAPALIAPIPMPNPPMTPKDISYLGLAHPWAKLSTGKMLISWSVNSNDPSFLGDIRYGVRLSEVDLNPAEAPPPPPAPTSLTTTAGNELVNLSWTSMINAHSYNIYQKDITAGATTFTKVGSFITNTAYTASGLTNNHTYQFEISSVNEGGEGALSAPVEAKPVPPIITKNFPAIADSYAIISYPSSIYGTRTYFWVDGSPTTIGYLKFDLRTLSGKKILKAVLKLKSINDSTNGYVYIKPVGNTSWSEGTLKYSNKPAVSSTVLGTIRPGYHTYYWFSNDITSGINSKAGQYTSLALTESSTDGINFYSRESAYDPVLVVTYQ